MKGVLLAAGIGSRLFPITKVVNKPLQPVYDKPMIYYPLTIMIQNGIKEICLICSPQDISRFKQLLGDGSPLGIKLEYREQKEAKGTAHAFLIAESFIGKDNSCMLFGDNIFDYDFSNVFKNFKNGATAFGFKVDDPRRFGVIEVDNKGNAVSIEEKPEKPKSNLAVIGIYLFDNHIIELSKKIKPSIRGDLEITDALKDYIKEGKLKVHEAKGAVWLDAGKPDALYDAATYVKSVEKQKGIKLGCPEEAAYKQGNINKKQLEKLINEMPNCEYKEYLKRLLS